MSHILTRHIWPQVIIKEIGSNLSLNLPIFIFSNEIFILIKKLQKELEKGGSNFTFDILKQQDWQKNL